MSTNLRMSKRAAAVLREASRHSGRSQQDLLREAVDRFLGLTPDEHSRDRAIAAGLVRPSTPFRDVTPSITLAPGMTTRDLLDREDGR